MRAGVLSVPGNAVTQQDDDPDTTESNGSGSSQNNIALSIPSPFLFAELGLEDIWL